MAIGSRPFETFLRRVHRREVVVRLAERIGLGLLGGCVTALPLLGIALWRGMETAPLAVSAMGLGAIAGAVWGIISRPRIFDAAMEADRQLRWDDLLSSAWTLRNRPLDEPWTQMVLDLADERSRTAQPSRLVLNRLGARTWGGIGLASALVIVLALLPTYAVPTEADPNVQISRQIDSAERPADADTTFARASRLHRTAVQQDPDELTKNSNDTVEPAAPGSADNSRQAIDGSEKHQGNGFEQNGTGTGASRGNSPDRNTLATAHHATTGQRPDVSANLSGGVGESSANGPDSTASGSIAGASALRPERVPPWQSPSWITDTQAAKSAVENGRIPQAYGEIVRQYFGEP